MLYSYEFNPLEAIISIYSLIFYKVLNSKSSGFLI